MRGTGFIDSVIASFFKQKRGHKFLDFVASPPFIDLACDIARMLIEIHEQINLSMDYAFQ